MGGAGLGGARAPFVEAAGCMEGGGGAGEWSGGPITRAGQAGALPACHLASCAPNMQAYTLCAMYGKWQRTCTIAICAVPIPR